jgi:hypothetical protein
VKNTKQATLKQYGLFRYIMGGLLIKPQRLKRNDMGWGGQASANFFINVTESVLLIHI